MGKPALLALLSPVFVGVLFKFLGNLKGEANLAPEVCLHTRICIHMYAYMHACTCTLIHACTRTHIHAYAHECTHTHKHVHTHTRTHTHTHTRTNTHNCEGHEVQSLQGSCERVISLFGTNKCIYMNIYVYI